MKDVYFKKYFYEPDQFENIEYRKYGISANKRVVSNRKEEYRDSDRARAKRENEKKKGMKSLQGSRVRCLRGSRRGIIIS